MQVVQAYLDVCLAWLWDLDDTGRVHLLTQLTDGLDGNHNLGEVEVGSKRLQASDGWCKNASQLRVRFSRWLTDCRRLSPATGFETKGHNGSSDIETEKVTRSRETKLLRTLVLECSVSDSVGDWDKYGLCATWIWL